MTGKLLSGLLSGPDRAGTRKVTATVIIIERNASNVKGIGDNVLNILQDLVGQNVEFRLVSATVRDPNNGNRGLVGPAAYLEKCVLANIPTLLTGETPCSVNFSVHDCDGVPGAVIVKNHHKAEFFLKTITIDNFPGQGRINFDCNSWIHNTDKYSGRDRVFFSDDILKPNVMPSLLLQFWNEEQNNPQEEDAIWRVDKYNCKVARCDHVNKKGCPCLVRRLHLGCSLKHRDPRRRKIARWLKTDGFGHITAGEFQGVTIKTESNDLMAMHQALLKLTPKEFDSFKEALDLNERGHPLPDIPLVKNLLELAPIHKFRSVVKSIVAQYALVNPPQRASAEKFRDLLPMLKAVLNLAPNEFDLLKEVLNFYAGGLPLPDIPVVRKFLEHAPGDKFKLIFTTDIHKGTSSCYPPEGGPLKKLKDLVPMLMVMLNFVPSEFNSFKDVLGAYEGGSPLPNIPIVRKFLEAAPWEKFKDVLKRVADQDSLFKSPEAAPFEKQFKELQPMLRAIMSFQQNELELFKKVLNNFEGGLPLPDITLVQKFLEAAPCNERFQVVHVPSFDKVNSFGYPEMVPVENFKDIFPTFQVISKFSANEFESFKRDFELLNAGSPLPNNPLVQKLLEAAPSKKFENMPTPDGEPQLEFFKDLLPMLKVIVKFTPNEFDMFKEAVEKYKDELPLQDSPLVGKILKRAPCEKLRFVLTATDGAHHSLFSLPESAHLENYFNGLLPMLHDIVNFKPNEIQSFKEVLVHYQSTSSLPSIPMVQNFLENAPCEKFKAVLLCNTDQSRSFKFLEDATLGYFKDIFPMLKAIMSFSPNEFDSFKETLNLYITKSQLMNTLVIRKFLEAAPNRKFEALLVQKAEHDNLFSSAEAATSEKYFKKLVPMLQVIFSMPATEFKSFKEALEHYGGGLPMPDIPVVHKFFEAAPCEDFMVVLKPI